MLLKQAGQLLRAEERAAEARRAAEQRLEREVRKKARQQAAFARERVYRSRAARPPTPAESAD